MRLLVAGSSGAFLAPCRSILGDTGVILGDAGDAGVAGDQDTVRLGTVYTGDAGDSGDQGSDTVRVGTVNVFSGATLASRRSILGSNPGDLGDPASPAVAAL